MSGYSILASPHAANRSVPAISPVSPRLAARPRPRRTVASVVFVARSFNHLVRPAEHRWWDRKTKRLSDAEIDPELELGRLLDWEVPGLGALENLVHESRRSARCLNVVRS